MGRAAGMCFLALILNEFADHTVADPAGAGLDGAVCLFAFSSHSVLHYHHVDVVHDAQGNKFLFAAQKGYLALVFKLVAVFDLDIFLGRNGHDDNIARKVIHYVGVCKGAGHAGYTGYHGVMAAAVSGARNGVGGHMSRNDDGVKLAHNSDPDLAFLAFERSYNTGDAHLVLV